MNYFDNIYFDFIPDEIINIVLISLDNIDIFNLLKLENFKYRDEVIKGGIKLINLWLYNKKSWYNQTWWEYLLRLSTSKSIPVISNGEIIDYIPYISKSTDYLINPSLIDTKIFILLSKASDKKEVWGMKVKLYEINTIILIEGGIITILDLLKEKNNVFLAIMLNTETLPQIEDEKSDSLESKGLLQGKIGFTRTRLIIGSYEIPNYLIEYNLFPTDTFRSIYGYTRKDEFYILDSSEFFKRGRICTSYSDTELLVFCSKLNILIKDDITHIQLCEKIKLKLIEIGHYYEFF